MVRFASGFLVGFFLATLLAFAFVQLSMGPYYGDLLSAREYMQEAYEITHSELYSGALDFIGLRGEMGPAISSIPFIGSAIDTSGFEEYSEAASELMIFAREISEKLGPSIGLWISVLEAAPFMMGFSALMIILGTALLFLPGGKQAPVEKEGTKGRSPKGAPAAGKAKHGSAPPRGGGKRPPPRKQY
jgi:hypothetical protein